MCNFVSIVGLEMTFFYFYNGGGGLVFWFLVLLVVYIKYKLNRIIVIFIRKDVFEG